MSEQDSWDAGPGNTRLENVGLDSPLLQQVVALADANRSFLGMLPRAAWEDYAKRGGILALVSTSIEDPDTVLGFVSFRLPRDQVVIAHLAVAKHARGTGVARQLVAEVSARYSDRRGIGLKCRRDFPATRVWPRLGFVARGETTGRSAEGHRLTLWWLDHGHRDLFSWQGAAETQIPVVIDANVFIDLHSQIKGVRQEETRVALDDILGDRIEVLVTPELLTELDRNQDLRERERLRGISSSYPSLPVSAAVMDDRLGQLAPPTAQSALSSRDLSDLKHIAYASAAGIAVLVTRDTRAVSRIGGEAARKLGVDLVNPGQLVTLVTERESEPSYWPAALQGTGYSVKEAGVSDRELVKLMFNVASKERKREFLSRVEQVELAGSTSSLLLFLDPQKHPVALLGTIERDGLIDVPLARVGDSPIAATLAAQLVSHLRAGSTVRKWRVVRVSDPYSSPMVREALHLDGFFKADSALFGVLGSGACTSISVLPRLRGLMRAFPGTSRGAPSPIQSLIDLASAARTPSERLEVERTLWPLTITDSDIDTWLIPIRSRYAYELLGHEGQLLPRLDGLGLSMEHVYYMGRRTGQRAPARVFWYVSGSHDMRVVGHSQLAEVAYGDWRSIYKQFRRLGIYGENDVRSAANRTGQVQALRFTHTKLFDKPIGLARLRVLACKAGSKLILRSASLVSPGLTQLVFEEAGLEQGIGSLGRLEHDDGALHPPGACREDPKSHQDC